MCFFASFAPATVFIVLGYFVLFSSTKVEGPVRTFGRVLAIWVFIVALGFPTMGTYLTLSGQCPITRVMEHLP